MSALFNWKFSLCRCLLILLVGGGVFFIATKEHELKTEDYVSISILSTLGVLLVSLEWRNRITREFKIDREEDHNKT
jgi:hypothetical protein